MRNRSMVRGRGVATAWVQWLIAVLLALAVCPARGQGTGRVLINEIMYHPSSEDSREEFIELHNSSPAAVDLSGWSIRGGVRFDFPAGSRIPGDGYVVVVADRARFQEVHPGVTNGVVLGDWIGQLSNSGEELELLSGGGLRVDRVTYADSGDWAERRRGAPDRGHQGWVWFAAHDGNGASLESRSGRIAVDAGARWGGSSVTNGTPGSVNSLHTTNLAPIITGVRHVPAVPGPAQRVLVTASLADEGTAQARLFYRRDPSPEWTVVPMPDNGLNGDGAAADGVVGAFIPPQPTGSVVEFFVEAVDEVGAVRTWPAAADGAPPGVGTGPNALFQVEEGGDTSLLPVYRLVMTEGERAEIAEIGSSSASAFSHAQMNATFLSHEAGHWEVRYLTGVRNRGFGSRNAKPNNYRVNFPGDNTWRGVSGINLNGQTPHAQVIGAALYRMNGVPMAAARPVRVLVNATNLAEKVVGHPGYYAHNDVVDGDFAATEFPWDPSGNVYRGIRVVPPGADFVYRGPEAASYRTNYPKTSNVSEDDYSDLTAMLQAIAPGQPAETFGSRVESAIHVEEWLRYFAVSSLMDNNETNPSNGDGDDFHLYAGAEDSRFYLIPRDLDSVFGQGPGGGLPTASLFRTAGLPVIDHLLKHPPFLRRYFQILTELRETTLSGDSVERITRSILAPSTPADLMESVVRFTRARNSFVDSKTPRVLAITNWVAGADGWVNAVSGDVELKGTADVLTTASVRVNGLPARWVGETGGWSFTNRLDGAGFHRVEVEAVSESGTVMHRTALDFLVPGVGPTTVSGTLAAGTNHWRADLGPIRVTGNVVVPVDGLLVIDAGASVYFSSGSGIEVRGRLIAEGTPTARIRFMADPSVLPARADAWRGISLVGAVQTNRVTHADFHGAGEAGYSINLSGSTLVLDGCRFSGTTRTLVETHTSSLHAVGCTFPTLQGRELIHGADIAAGGFMVFERCRFGTTTGLNDIIDFSRARRPAPILELYDNVFTGASDDVLDLDGCDAHIEGNIFMNVSNGDLAAADTSSAISYGEDGGYGPHVVAVRNLFFNTDHVALCKEGGFLTLQNNTAVGCAAAGVNFSEPLRGVLPGRGAHLEGNIFRGLTNNFENLRPSNGTVEVTLVDNLLAGIDTPEGTPGALRSDPRLVRETGITAESIRDDFALRPGSPAVGAGRGGGSLGALVPEGPIVFGEPGEPVGLDGQFVTPRTDATLGVAGPGVVRYRFRLDDGEWSTERGVDLPIVLTGLEPGFHRVWVEGINSAGRRRAAAVGSRPWLVTSPAAVVRFSEVIASGVSGPGADPGSADAVELENTGSVPVVLAALRIEHRSGGTLHSVAAPVATALNPGQRLVFASGTGPAAAGVLALGFQLDSKGGDLRLYDGAQLLDQVVFGPQLRGRSIARDRVGQWRLAEPTLGGTNRLVAVGDPALVRLNEWMAVAALEGEPDRVELFNADTLPVDVGGWGLTEHPWGVEIPNRLPPLSFIEAGGFLVLEADGGRGLLETGFKLASDQGLIGWVSGNGRIQDRVAYGPQLRGVSEGRLADGTLSRFDPPSFGAANRAEGGSVTNVVTERITLVTGTNVWAFSATGQNPGSGWQTPGFDDLGWGRGPALFAHGDDLLSIPTGTVIPYTAPQQLSFFFRTHFRATNGVGSTFFLSHVVDDGAVFYLNGEEFLRYNMPAGPVTTTTRASTTISTARLIGPAPVALTNLVDGENLIAVEVHQPNSTSTDMAFAIVLEQVTSRTNIVGPTAEVLLSEVLADNQTLVLPDGSVSDGVELFNPGTAAMDLAGMSLSTDADTPRMWVFPEGSRLAGGGYLWIACDPLRPQGPANTGFALGRAGETVHLFAPVGAGGGLKDAVTFGIQAGDVSVARMFPARAWLAASPTPGFPNIAVPMGDASALRINEWMAEQGSGDDWFEIHNSSTNTVALAGLHLSDTLAEPGLHTVAGLSFIAPRGYVKWVADGQVSKSATHVGFKLSAKGEMLLLSRPDGEIVDQVLFGPQQAGVSMGRLPDGSTNIVPFVSMPTPGAMNVEDADADGLPDAWERRFGLDPTVPVDAGQDSDGDGASDVSEYQAGTDPTAGAQHLSLTAALGPADRLEIAFVAEPGREYRLEATAELGTGSWTEVARVSARSVPRRITRTVPLDGASTGAFFRLIVLIPE